MIFDKIENLKNYASLHPYFEKALAGIAKYKDAPVGKYELMGEDLFLSVQSYQPHSKNALSFENHKKYIDIQFMIDGDEEIMTEFTDKNALTEAYSAEKDVEFYRPLTELSTYRLTGGKFLILFPGEAHAPGLEVNPNSKAVKKIVVKVLVK